MQNANWPWPDMTAETLLRRARAAAERAYAPYSNFKVGAALLTSDRSVILGCNVENASYGLSICAERSAIGNMVAIGHLDPVAIASRRQIEYPVPSVRGVPSSVGGI